ncbi:hypothetical protein M8494_21770 [Serratia ureilytica]
MQSGANVARWCGRVADRADLAGDSENQPRARQAVSTGTGDLRQKAGAAPLATWQCYATRSNPSGYVRDVNACNDAKAKLN